MDWHILVNNAPVGPLAEPEAMGWVRSGRLRPWDLVWSPGMPGWVPAHQTQPFAAVFAGVASLPPKPLGDDPAMRWVLPVGRSGWAIAAGYLGLFAVLVLPAPVALAVGILALRDLKRDPSKHGKGRAVFGIVMGALGTIALCALLLNSAR